MADVLSSQKTILQAAVFFLRNLSKKEGEVNLPKFPLDLFPNITPEDIRSFLTQAYEVKTLEDLLKRKNEILADIERINEQLSAKEPLPKIIPPKGTVIPQKMLDPKEVLENLSSALKKLQKKGEKETVVYKAEPAKPPTATETAVQSAIKTIEEKIQGGLETAVEENPTLGRKIKQSLETVAQEAGKTVESQLGNLTSPQQAVNWAQKVLEDYLPRDKAYDIAHDTIPSDIKSTAIRHQVSLMNKRNQGIRAATELVQQSLTKIPINKIPFAEKVIEKAIGSVLTRELVQKSSRDAQELIETTIRQALSKDGLSSESIDSVAEVIASQKASKTLQELAQTTSVFNALPPPIKLTAFQQTVPRGAEKAVLEIKGLILYGFGKSPSKIEESRAETLATETAKRLIERGIRIAKLRERGLRARIPAEKIPAEEIPRLVKETITTLLDPKKHGLNFTEQVQQEIEKVKELPAPLSQSIEKLFKTPSPTSPEKERAITAIKKFIRENIPGGVLPKEIPQLNKIAEAIIEKVEREFQIPVSTKKISEMVKTAITDCLGEEPGRLAQRAERGTRAIPAEKLPPSLLKRVKDFLEKSPAQLSGWELEQIESLVHQGILSHRAAAVYQKELIQREKTNAFLSSPASPPGLVSKISGKALASYLASRKEEKELLKNQQALIDQAKEFAPKNKVARSLLNRLFRLFSKEKDPLKTLKNISDLGPSNINIPSQFKRQIFRRFINAFFHKKGLRKTDRASGKSYSRFGKKALKRVFSKLFSRIKNKLTPGIKRGIRKILKTVGRLLGKIIKPILKALGKLVLPALKALAGFLANTLLPFLIGLGSQIAGFLLSLATAITSTVGLPVVLIVLAAIIIVIILVIIIQGFLHPGAFVDYSQTAEYGSCNLVDHTILNTALVSTFQSSGQSFKVPPAVIAGVANIEGHHLWSYTDIEILAFSEEGEQDPYKTCQPNECGARGPMQFLTGEEVDEDKCPQAVGVDVWSVYREAVNEVTNEGRTPHVCNIKDSIFAAAKKLKGDSQTTPENDCQWNKEQVYNAARGYYGKCEYEARWGDTIIYGNYCQQVWEYYINHSVEPSIEP